MIERLLWLLLFIALASYVSAMSVEIIKMEIKDATTLKSNLRYVKYNTDATEMVHHHLNSSILESHYQFRQRKQMTDESILNYAINLQKLARTCNYGKTLNDNLRDQFLYGLKSDGIRLKLFAKGLWSFTETFNNAILLDDEDAATSDEVSPLVVTDTTETTDINQTQESSEFRGIAVTPFALPIPNGLYAGRIISVVASTSPEAQRFSVNLQCSPSFYPKADIAFHLGFRFDEKTIVRNHFMAHCDEHKNCDRTRWGSEEREGGMPLERGESLMLLLVCEEKYFKVFINGVYFTKFEHRLPYQRITHVNFEHQITVEEVQFTNASEIFPLTYPIENGIYPGRALLVKAFTPPEAQWFTINLQCGPNSHPKDDVAFHFSVRFDEKTIVRTHSLPLCNDRENCTYETWGVEEKEGGNPIARGEPFELVILCEEQSFKVLINGTYFTEFKHRIPYKRITHWSFVGGIVVTSSSFVDASKVTPFTYPIDNGMYPGKTIRVRAQISPDAQRFAINLQCGPSVVRKDDIAFHLGFRFDQNAIARNNFSASSAGEGRWGSEQNEGGIPIARGEPFQVLVLCEEQSFKVFINGVYFTEFQHRMPYQRITHVNFEGEITVKSVSFALKAATLENSVSQIVYNKV